MSSARIGDLVIEYSDAGDGPHIILLHGWMASKEYWREAPIYLPEYRLVMPDLPGFGGSSKPHARYDRAFFRTSVLRFLEFLGIESCVMVGHSMGCLIAADLILSEPQMFSGLVLVSSPLGFSREMKPFPHYLREPFSRLALGPGLKTSLAMRYIGTTVGHVQPELMTFLLREASRAYWLAGTRTAEMIWEENTGKEMEPLDLPTLVIWGEEDPLRVQGLDIVQKELLPRAEFVFLRGCGHVPMLSHPTEFYGALRSFLRRSVGGKESPA